MAKAVDWQKHIKRFLKSGDLSPGARKEYAAHHKLVYNTFRIQLSKYVKSPAYKNSVAQNTPAAQAKRKSAERSIKKSPKSSADGATGARAHVAKIMPRSKADIFEMPDGTRSFRRGNRSGLVTGAYAKKAFLSKEYEEKSQLTVTDLLDMYIAKFALFNDCSTQRVADIVQAYKDGEPVTRQKVDDKGELTIVELSLEEAINAVNTQALDVMGESIKVINSVQTGIETLEMRRHNLPLFTGEQMAQYRAEIMVRSVKEEWDAERTCNEFYAVGLVPPAGLEADKVRQLKASADTAPEDDGALEPDEAARLRAVSEGIIPEDQVFLDERKQAMEKLFAEYQGHGTESLVVSRDEDEDE